MKQGRRLAFDFGTVRIGVAASDNSGIISTPLPFISNDENLLANLTSQIAEYQPIYIVVGIPKLLSGSSGGMAKEVTGFVSEIKNVYSGEIFGIDERFSSKVAHELLREKGKSSKEARHEVDSVAAAAIFNVALDFEAKGELFNCAL